MNRERVAEAIAYYNSLLETRHLQSTRELMLSAVRKYVIDEEGRGLSLCTAMRPYFLTHATYQKAMRNTRLVYAGIRRVAERLAQDKRLRRGIGIPEHMDRIIEIDQEKGGFPVVSRLDSFLGPDGATGFIESNSDPLLPVVAEVDLLFASMPIAEDFAKKFRFRSMPLYDLALDALHIDHHEQARAGVPTIAMVRTDTASISQGDFYRWLAYASARGCTVLLAKPEEFEYKDHRLYAAGTVVDSLALSTAWDYILDPPESMNPVLQAIRDGAVGVLNGLSRALLSSYKNIFEMLSDPRYQALFDRDVVTALREHVPWTRVVRDRTTQYRGEDIDLLPFITDHREEFVLKPSGGRGGAGVVLGWNSTPEAWQATLHRAQVQSYVVQERVRGLDIAPLHVLDGDTVCIRELSADFNPFVWNGSRAEGCFVRYSSATLQNLAAGGSIAAVWILEDDTP